jgi:hypothetical protein
VTDLLDKQWAWLGRHEDDVDDTAYNAGLEQFVTKLGLYEWGINKQEGTTAKERLDASRKRWAAA